MGVQFIKGCLYFIVHGHKTQRELLGMKTTLFHFHKTKNGNTRAWTFNNPCYFLIMRKKAHDLIIASSICLEIFSFLTLIVSFGHTEGLRSDFSENETVM